MKKVFFELLTHLNEHKGSLGKIGYRIYKLVEAYSLGDQQQFLLELIYLGMTLKGVLAQNSKKQKSNKK